MKVEIKYRKSKCDRDSYFYELYVNNLFVCGLNSFEMINERLKMALQGKFSLSRWY